MKLMNVILYEGQSKFWKLRDREKLINEYVNNNARARKQLKERFQKLQFTNMNGDLEQASDGRKRRLKIITKDKIRITLFKLKNRKAPALNEIRNDMLKYYWRNYI